MNAFSFENVSLSYGDIPALQQITFSTPAGDHLALLGPSGAGKSSILGLLNARLLPSSGSVLVAGQDLSTLSAKRLRQARQQIAWIPQDLGLVPTLRVYQNVALGQAGKKGTLGTLRSLLAMPQSEQETIDRLLDRVGISEKIFTRLDQLSGGQQQRVAIARALYQKPTLILADEPASALDPGTARRVLQLLCEVSTESGATLVMSLHNPDLAREFFPNLLALKDGRINYHGPALDFDPAIIY